MGPALPAGPLISGGVFPGEKAAGALCWQVTEIENECYVTSAVPFGLCGVELHFTELTAARSGAEQMKMVLHRYLSFAGRRNPS